jgi:hypothetical protein
MSGGDWLRSTGRAGRNIAGAAGPDAGRGTQPGGGAVLADMLAGLKYERLHLVWVSWPTRTSRVDEAVLPLADRSI